MIRVGLGSSRAAGESSVPISTGVTRLGKTLTSRQRCIGSPWHSANSRANCLPQVLSPQKHRVRSHFGPLAQLPRGAGPTFVNVIRIVRGPPQLAKIPATAEKDECQP